MYLTPKIFLMASGLAFSLKEDPVRCAKVCDKSWVILQTVCYVGNPESDDNCRQSLTFDKKIPHKVCQLLHNRDILGSQILGQISALMRCVKLKAKRQKNKNMT